MNLCTMWGRDAGSRRKRYRARIPGSSRYRITAGTRLPGILQRDWGRNAAPGCGDRVVRLLRGKVDRCRHSGLISRVRKGVIGGVGHIWVRIAIVARAAIVARTAIIAGPSIAGAGT